MARNFRSQGGRRSSRAQNAKPGFNRKRTSRDERESPAPGDGRRHFRDTEGKGKRNERIGKWSRTQPGGRPGFNRKRTSRDERVSPAPRDSRLHFRDTEDKGKRNERMGPPSRTPPGRTRSGYTPGKRARRGHAPGKPARNEGKPEYGPRKKTFIRTRIEKQRTRLEAGKTATVEPRPTELIRLNKFISNSGVCSRREADELIKLGLVTVNGKAITELGTKVKPTDDIRYEGKKLTSEKPVYILLNKPKGFITTTDDPHDRNTVMSLIAGAVKERVYPVGRLDRNTTGLLLFTNDGDLADKLTHPSYNAKKIYKVELDRPLSAADLQRIVEGVQLEEGRARVDDLAVVSDDRKTIGIEIHIGWNHIVRRIFESLQYKVVKLDRVVYAGLDKRDLPRGKWRFLKPEEVVRLKHFK